MPADICKSLNVFHDGTHGLSPGTDGSNPSPSSRESVANRTSSASGDVSKKCFPLRGDRGFEAFSLQRRVRLSPETAFVGRESRLFARVCAAGLATGSAETRRVFRYHAKRRQYLCRAIFQYRSAADGVGDHRETALAKSRLLRA